MTATFFTYPKIPQDVRTRTPTKWVHGKMYIKSAPPVYKNGLYKMREPKAIFWANHCPAQNDGLCRARAHPFCAGNFKGDFELEIPKPRFQEFFIGNSKIPRLQIDFPTKHNVFVSPVLAVQPTHSVRTSGDKNTKSHQSQVLLRGKFRWFCLVINRTMR